MDFLIDENLNYGSLYYLWIGACIPPNMNFSKILWRYILLNYEVYGQRHSPLYLVFLSFFYKLGLSLDIIRIIHLHLCVSLIFIFINI